MAGKLIGRLRAGLAWHYVGQDGKTANCMGVIWSGNQGSPLVDIHPRGEGEPICGACAWEDQG